MPIDLPVFDRLPKVRAGEIRSSAERLFWFNIHPCPRCGSRDRGSQKSTSDWMHTTCNECGFERLLQFIERPDFGQTPKRAGRYPALGAPGSVSTIIRVDEFLRELDYHRSNWEREIANDDISERRGHVLDAELCIEELRAFLGEADDIPDQYVTAPETVALRAEHPDWFTRAFLDAAAAYWQPVRVASDAALAKATAEYEARIARGEIQRPGLGNKPPVVPPLSNASLTLHKAWRAGQFGGQQLRVTNKHAPRVRVDRADLTQAEFADADLTEARLEACILEETTFERVRAPNASFAGSRFREARLTDCLFENADFTNAGLTAAYFIRCDLRGARFDRAAADSVTFIDCDLRGASFAEIGVYQSSRGMTFERCDLRGSTWPKAELDRTNFKRCQFAGLTGPIAQLRSLYIDPIEDARALTERLRAT